MTLTESSNSLLHSTADVSSSGAQADVLLEDTLLNSTAPTVAVLPGRRAVGGARVRADYRLPGDRRVAVCHPVQWLPRTYNFDISILSYIICTW